MPVLYTVEICSICLISLQNSTFVSLKHRTFGNSTTCLKRQDTASNMCQTQQQLLQKVFVSMTASLSRSKTILDGKKLRKGFERYMLSNKKEIIVKLSIVYTKTGEPDSDSSEDDKPPQKKVIALVFLLISGSKKSYR